MVRFLFCVRAITCNSSIVLKVILKGEVGTKLGGGIDLLSQKLMRVIVIVQEFTACLSSAAKLTRRQRGRKLEHRVARSQRGTSAVVVFAHFFLLFLYNLSLLRAVLGRWKI